MENEPAKTEKPTGFFGGTGNPESPSIPWDRGKAKRVLRAGNREQRQGGKRPRRRPPTGPSLIVTSPQYLFSRKYNLVNWRIYSVSFSWGGHRACGPLSHLQRYDENPAAFPSEVLP